METFRPKTDPSLMGEMTVIPDFNFLKANNSPQRSNSTIIDKSNEKPSKADSEKHTSSLKKRSHSVDRQSPEMSQKLRKKGVSPFTRQPFTDHMKQNNVNLDKIKNIYSPRVSACNFEVTKSNLSTYRKLPPLQIIKKEKKRPSMEKLPRDARISSQATDLSAVSVAQTSTSQLPKKMLNKNPNLIKVMTKSAS